MINMIDTWIAESGVESRAHQHEFRLELVGGGEQQLVEDGEVIAVAEAGLV